MRGTRAGGVYDWDLDYLSLLLSFVYVILGTVGFAALAVLLAVVTQGDAYLFAPLCGFSGGVRSLSSPCPLVL